MSRNLNTRNLAAAAFAVAMIAATTATRPVASLHSPGVGQDQGIRGGEGSGGLAMPKGSDPKALAVAAYIYGYPLVTMEMTRRVMTNVEKPDSTRAPMGQLVHMRTYPTAAYREVAAPNADTLYTRAFVDVGKEPWI